MFKKFKSLLLIVILAMSFTIQLETEAEGRHPMLISKWGLNLASICASALLKHLQNVTTNETLLSFSASNFFVEYRNINFGGNKPGIAQGLSHIGETFVVTQPIAAEIVRHNGTAEITDLCIVDDGEGDPLYDAIMSEILPNPNWENDWFYYLQFDVRFVLESELGGIEHVIEATCEPSDGEIPCTVTYDSHEM